MTTNFFLLCKFCGLSTPHAASFLGQTTETIEAWGNGKEYPTQEAMNKLIALADRITDATDAAIEQIDQFLDGYDADGGKAIIELGYAQNDVEAQCLGWPCLETHMKVLELVVAQGMDEVLAFQLVPWGATPATKAAMQVR